MTKYTSLDQLPKFESINDALDENEIRISTLRYIGGEDYEELANRLWECNKGELICNSLACKLCNRNYRLARVNTLVEKVLNTKNSWWIVTIIDYERAFTDLDTFDVRKSKDRLRKILERSGFEGPIVGSFEIDFHESCGLWLPHFHLLCPSTIKNKQAKEVLKEKLHKQQSHHIKKGRKARPVKFQKLQNPYEQISYIYKLVFNLVHDYESCRTNTLRTRKLRLPDSMLCWSLCWMDRLGRRGVLFSFKDRGDK
ncbi:hypothetical protein [Photobacterium leiognathi]|uniref:hypothetical protein n=1 Tax=Photobacterium leiognathi TaxID=553611 RepID=UPI002981F720|nr:hypothetical protein [Photobacterium leiognathi]